jgi:hypothetical protein
MMGVPIDGPSYMFGDNQNVITSSTMPHSMLGKRHNMLSYHQCREAIANPSDMMTEFLAHSVSYLLVNYFLFLEVTYWRLHLISQNVC